MFHLKNTLLKQINWQKTAYSKKDIKDIEFILEENYFQVTDISTYFYIINYLLENNQLPLLKRYCKWLDFFSQKIHSKTRIYGEIVNSINEAVLKNEVFKNQTELEFKTSLYFFEMLYSENKDISLTEIEPANYLLNSALFYGKYPGLQINSLKKAFYFLQDDLSIVCLQNLFSCIFVKFENPLILTIYLDRFKRIIEFEALAWVIMGKNISKFNDKTSVLSKKDTYYFTHFHHVDLHYNDFILERAIIISKLLNNKLKKTDLLFEILHVSKLFQNEPLTLLSDIDFWKDATLFYCNNNQNEFEMLGSASNYIDFIENQRYNQETKFSFKGRTVKSISNLIEEWHLSGAIKDLKQLQLKKWKKGEILDFEMEYLNKKYIVKELTTGNDLYEESKSQKNCVFSYADYCIAKQLRIYSLRKIVENMEISQVTIEVSQQQIKQATGFRNQSIKKHEFNILKKWAALNQLKFDYYY